MNTLRPIAIAFAFLTRLPVPTSNVQETDFGRSMIWFPVVGLAIGFAMAGARVLIGDRLSPALVSLGLVALLVVLTGGLHLDGFGDVFDGLGGGHGNRERTLAIMRDSRIGSHGAAALALLLTGKVLALSEILRHGIIWPLIAFPVVARWAVIPLVLFFPYARSEGLGKPFHGNAKLLHFVLATFLTLGSIVWVGPTVVAPTASALVVALLLGAWFQHRLGGLTGDVYGAAIEACELFFLVVASRLGNPLL